MSKKMIQAIERTGRKLELLAMPDGSRLSLLPYGARGLGLYAAGSDENFFWTNPALDGEESAKALFALESWHNTGGDRTWIAPELDANYLDKKYEQYWQPRRLDMSVYQVDCLGGGCRLSQEMTLKINRSGGNVDLRLTKWFGPAANPLRRDRDMADVLGAVQFAGYTQRMSMQSLDNPFQPAELLGIWNLIQLPEGGEMIAPTYSRATPQPCFGNVPADHVAVEDHVVCMDMRLNGSHKLALKATATCGRVGYAYRQGNAYSLVIRNFSVNPSGEYVDVQKHDPADLGYSVQLCRVDEAAFGSFCELEYHAPAWGELPDPARSEDVSQVWAFRGSRETIDAVARKLLGTTPHFLA